MRSEDPRPSALLIYAITITGITNITLVAPAIPDILAGLGAPTSMAGLVIASATLPGIVLAPTIGVLADRYGRREILVPCLLVYGAAGAAAGLAPSMWVLVVLRLLQGVGAAGLINLAVVLIGDHWAGVERARMIGRNAAALTASVVVLPPLGGLLTDLGGWRLPFLIYAAAFGTAWAVLRGLPRSRVRDGTVGQQLREAWPVLRSPAMLAVLTAGVVAMVLIFGLLLTVLPLYIEARFGLGAGARGLVLGLSAASATVGALSMGRLRQRFARRHLMVAGAAAWAGALAILSTADALLVLLGGVLLFGVGDGLTVPNLQDLAVGISEASRGTVVAVSVGAIRLGQTVGPLIAATGFGLLGGPTMFALGAGLAVVMGAGLLVAGRGRGASLPGGTKP